MQPIEPGSSSSGNYNRASFEKRKQDIGKFLEKNPGAHNAAAKFHKVYPAYSQSPSEVKKQKVVPNITTEQISKTETTETKFNFLKFISSILTKMKKAISQVHIFAHFKNEKTADIKQSGLMQKENSKLEKLSLFQQKLTKSFPNLEGFYTSEGIFRLSGSSEKVDKAFKTLLSSKNLEKDMNRIIKGLDHNDFASLYKKVIREMNLFGKEFHTQFYSAAKTLQGKKKEEQLVILKDLVNLLPPERKEDLKVYLGTFIEASKYQSVNKMGIKNLAIVASTNLDTTDVDMATNFQFASLINTLGLLMLENYHDLFPEQTKS